MAIIQKPLKNYDFADVNAVVSLPVGIPGVAQFAAGFTANIEGYADGTGIGIAKQAAGFTFQVGNDGEPLRSRSNNEHYNVTLTLMQSSDSNDLLSALHNADLQFGLGVFDFAIRDLSGRTTFDARSCFIMQNPDIEFAREGTTREWTIICPSVLVFTGGNAQAGLI